MFPGFNQHANCKFGQQQSITFFKPIAPVSFSTHRHTHTHTLACPFPPRGQVWFLATLMRARSPLCILLFRHRQFGSKSVGSEPLMSPRRCGGRTEGEFSRVTQSSRKRSKRICAYLTSPLDGQIRECRAAVKSCDKVARP